MKAGVAAAAIAALFIWQIGMAQARGSYSSSRERSPRTHYANQGGHYSGGHGSSHRSGHYHNSRTGNHYTHHRHK